MYRLTKNIQSNFNSSIYGKVGEEVNIISCHDGKIAVVENVLNKNRYTVFMEDLTTEDVKIEAKPDTIANHKSINNRVSLSKKRATPINQKELF